LQRIADADRTLPGLAPADYHLQASERLNERISRSWNRLVGLWASFSASISQFSTDGEPGTGPTRERWLLPLLTELDFGRLQPAKAEEIDGKTYPVSHRWEGRVPVHLVGAGVGLDRRSAGVAGAAKASPHGLVQELLNRTDPLWGIVSNGRVLRLLRDNASLTRQAYVEFDLEAMMAGEVYADFVLLFLLLHQSRFEGERAAECILERWKDAAQAQGTRAREQLRGGVERALEVLGAGFLAYPANHALRERLRAGDLSTQDYYRQLLRLVYRVIFLLVAEDRALLHPPGTPEQARSTYARYYSTARIRSLAERRRGTKHPDLFEGLKVVMVKLGEDEGSPELGLPFLGSFLFSPAACPDVDVSALANADLLEVTRALAFTTRGNVLRAVDYRNLGSEELGSVYESLLELHPEVYPEAASFTLATAAGNERKTTGSYYTPTTLISALLDSALDPVLAVASDRPTAEERARAILDLKVLDPACGSGHFLVAAAHRIARRLAAVRTGENEPSPEAYRTALRDVISRCVYGIDVNPMAVELCKVSLWMEAVEPGKPLSFLDHHVLCGNSLLGTTPKLLEAGVPDEAFTVLAGDDSVVVSQLKRRNRQERAGQQVLALGYEFNELESALAVDALRLDQRPDDSTMALHEKEHAFRDLMGSSVHERAKLIADTWCAAFVAPKRAGKTPLTQGAIELIAAGSAPEDLTLQVRKLAAEHRFLHWELAFPAVFHGQPGSSVPGSDAVTHGGFDVVVGNPPFVNAIEGGVAERSKPLLRFTNAYVGGTADLAYYFLATSTRMIRPGGRIGLVQPRAVLNAPPVRAVRAQLVGSLRPNLLYAPDRSDLFDGPAVFVALLVLGPDRECRVSRDYDVATASWVAGCIEGDNWWAEMGRLLRGGKRVLWAGSIVADVFAVGASMTTADAYDVVPSLVDQAGGLSQKLVTTGLIEPRQCLWGEINCRYLKRDYRYPRVVESGVLTKSLRRRLENARRPKIVVAGLSKRIECFVDRQGEYIGAVSTFSIFHPRDEVAELDALCEELLSDEFTDRFVEELGGNAMGGGNTTMKKSFLAALPYGAHIGG
jgi:methylase of polypeptide subunit release factors